MINDPVLPVEVPEQLKQMETLQSLTDQMTPDQLELYYAVLNEVERYRSLTRHEKLKLIRDVMDRPYVDLLCDWAFKHVFGTISTCWKSCFATYCRWT